MNIRRRGLAPVGRGLCTVKVAVLAPVEHVEDGAGNTSRPREVANGRGVVVDPADTAEAGALGANEWPRCIEALGAASQATEKMPVADLGGCGHQHALSLPTTRMQIVPTPTQPPIRRPAMKKSSSLMR
ncbi:hypothetical protein D3C86_1718160 [compost metagenome]